MATASRVADFDLFGHGRPTQGAVPASNTLTCPDDIFGNRKVHIKAACGLLNAESGVLLIGVGNNGQVLGIEDDFTTLGTRQNTDGYKPSARVKANHPAGTGVADGDREPLERVITEALWDAATLPALR